MRVLIVDDEPDILLLLRLTLEAEGFETVLAADGERALEHLREGEFDAVLLDVMMPVLDGWGVLEHVKRAGPPTPIVVVSAKTSEYDIARALKLGAAEYVTKPFDPGLLPSLIASLVAMSPEEREVRRKAALAAVEPG